LKFTSKYASVKYKKVLNLLKFRLRKKCLYTEQISSIQSLYSIGDLAINDEQIVACMHSTIINLLVAT
jgi:hypothetical protein